MKRMTTLLLFLLATTASWAMAMVEMDNGSKSEATTFVHSAMAGDIHAVFKVMGLQSMTDSAGNTHHVMTTFTKNSEQISTFIGKVTLVSPSGEAQLADLNFSGGGTFTANFTINEPGKWGVLCRLERIQESKQAKSGILIWSPDAISTGAVEVTVPAVIQPFRGEGIKSDILLND